MLRILVHSIKLSSLQIGTEFVMNYKSINKKKKLRSLTRLIVLYTTVYQSRLILADSKVGLISKDNSTISFNSFHFRFDIRSVFAIGEKQTCLCNNKDDNIH